MKFGWSDWRKPDIRQTVLDMVSENLDRALDHYIRVSNEPGEFLSINSSMSRKERMIMKMEFVLGKLRDQS